MQEKVSRAIVDTLKLKLTVAQDRKIAKRPIANVQAYEFYLGARDAMYRAFTSEGIDEAIRFLEAGLRITADNALLLATLANVYFQAVRVWVKEEADLVKAEEYAQKALCFDPSMAPAYMVLGYIQWFRGNPREGFPLVKQALSLGPNDVDALMWTFWLFIMAGKTSAAFDIAKHVAELDPIHPYRFAYQAFVHAYEGQFQLAVENIRTHVPAAVLEQPVWVFWLSFWLVYAGRAAEAMDVLEPIEKSADWNLDIQIPRLMRFALKRQRRSMDELAIGKFKEATKRDCVLSCMIGGA